MHGIQNQSYDKVYEDLPYNSHEEAGVRETNDGIRGSYEVTNCTRGSQLEQLNIPSLTQRFCTVMCQQSSITILYSLYQHQLLDYIFVAEPYNKKFISNRIKQKHLNSDYFLTSKFVLK